MFYATIGNLTANSSADIGVRVGYLALCMAQRSDSANLWICNSNPETLEAGLNTTDDPLSLIRIAGSFKSQAVLAVLA